MFSVTKFLLRKQQSQKLFIFDSKAFSNTKNNIQSTSTSSSSSSFSKDNSSNNNNIISLVNQQQTQISNFFNKNNKSFLSFSNAIIFNNNFRSIFTSSKAFPLRGKKQSNNNKESNNKNNKKSNNKDEDEDSSSGGEFDIASVKQDTQAPLSALKRQFANLQIIRATPNLIEKLIIDANGQKVALSKLGQVSIKDSQIIQVTLYDESMARACEKGIRDLNLGLTPHIEGGVLRVQTPRITTEYRASLAKLAEKTAEQVRNSLRQVRKKALDALKKANLPKDDAHKTEKDIQKEIDNANKEVETLEKAKVKELTSAQ